jgi:hypothetical protein
MAFPVGNTSKNNEKKPKAEEFARPEVRCIMYK